MSSAAQQRVKKTLNDVEVIVNKETQETIMGTVDIFLDQDAKQETYLVKSPNGDMVVTREEIQKFVTQEFELLKKEWEILEYEITKEKVYFKIDENSSPTYIGLINYCRLGMDEKTQISGISEKEAQKIQEKQSKSQNLQVEENVGIKGKDNHYSSKEEKRDEEKKSWFGRLLGF